MSMVLSGELKMFSGVKIKLKYRTPITPKPEFSLSTEENETLVSEEGIEFISEEVNNGH